MIGRTNATLTGLRTETDIPLVIGLRLATARALATAKPIAPRIQTESGHVTDRQETNDVNLATDVVIDLATGRVPRIVKPTALPAIKWTLRHFNATRRRRRRLTPTFVLGSIFLRKRGFWVE